MAETELERLMLRIDVDVERMRRELGKVEKRTLTFRDKLNKAVDKIRKRFNRLGNSIANVGRKLSLAGTVAAAGIGVMVAQSLKATDRIGKLSKTLGISTRDLAGFKLAADLGGTSLDTFARAARQVSKNVFDFVIRDTGEAKDAFEALGITVQDLRPIMNDQTALLGLIADRFNQLEDGAVKTALAVKIFGGRAAELLPALRGGSDALLGYRAEAERLGAALSTEAVEGVEKANDAFTRLKTLFLGVRDQITAALAPALEALATFLTETLVGAIQESGGSVDKWARGIVQNVLNMLRTAIEAVGKFTIDALKLGDDVVEAFGGDLVSTETTERIARFTTRASDLFQMLADKAAAAGDAIETGIIEGGEGFDQLGKAADEVSDRITEGLKPAVDDFGKSTGAVLDSLSIDFTDLFTDGKRGFKNLADEALRQLARIAKSKLFDALEAIDPTGITSVFRNLFQRRSGGGLPPGVPALVGEAGPELIQSRSPARVLNASDTRRAMSAGQPNVTVNVTNNFSTDLQTVQQQVAQATAVMGQTVQRQVLDLLTNPGIATV